MKTKCLMYERVGVSSQVHIYSSIFDLGLYNIEHLLKESLNI